MVVSAKVVSLFQSCKDCGGRMAVHGQSQSGNVKLGCVSCGCTTPKG